MIAEVGDLRKQPFVKIVVPSPDRELALGYSKVKTFDMVFKGFIEYPEDGLYRIHVGSGDGSKF